MTPPTGSSTALRRARELIAAGLTGEATDVCGELLDREPANAEALAVLAELAMLAHQPHLAEPLLERAVAICPAQLPLWMSLAEVQLARGNFEGCCRSYSEALRIEPLALEPRLRMAAAAIRHELYEQAEAWCREAMLLHSRHPAAQLHLAWALREQGDVPGARAAYDRALEPDPACANARWQLAACYLIEGDFARGWPLYELRSTVGDTNLDKYPYPRWDGGPLDGKTLLVHAEQGAGDEIMFASCYGDLAERGTCCVFVCEPRLVALFQRSFPQATMYGHRRRLDRAGAEIREPVDLQIPAGSLPLYLRPQEASFPERRGYLVPDAAAVQVWKKRYRNLGPGMHVGLSWKAGGKPSEFRRRSTTLNQWHELLRTPGVTWINLQYGDVSQELLALSHQLGVEIHDPPEGDPLVDLDAFAAKVAALDLVITVGNTTAHMAGALGTDCWTVLPRVPTWRWLASGEQTPWYRHLRLFRQDDRRNWDTVLSRVAGELRTLLESLATAGPTAGTTTIRTAGALPSRATAVPTTANMPNAQSPPSNLLESHDDIPAMLAQAHQCRTRGDLAEAERLCRTILIRAPRHEHTLYLLSVLARHTGRAALAAASLERALAVQDGAVLRLELADALASLGQTERALAECRRAVALKPHYAEAHLTLGKLLQSAGKATEAITAFEAALAARPDFAKAAGALGAALQSDRPGDALGPLRRAVELDPNYAAAWNNLGRAQHDLGHSEAALASYERAIAIQPAFAMHLNLGTLLLEMGRAAEASTQLEAASRLCPDCAETRQKLEAARRQRQAA